MDDQNRKPGRFAGIFGAAAGTAGGFITEDWLFASALAGAGTYVGEYIGTSVPTNIHSSNLFVKLAFSKVDILAIQKMNLDFNDSPLSPSGDINKALLESINKLSNAHIVGDPSKDCRIPNQPFIIFKTETWNGYSPERQVDLLKEEFNKEFIKPIVVNCACIEVAAVTTFLSMINRYSLNIKLDFSSSNGHDQIIGIQGREDIDFIITANPALFMSEKSYIEKTYRLELPCHGEMQYLFKRKDTLFSDIKRIAIFPNSSAEEQFRSKRGVPIGADSEEIKAAEIPLIITDLDKKQGVLIWEPMATALRNKYKVVYDPESVYRIWISLFSNCRWRNPKRQKLLKAFLEVFVGSWNYCSMHRSHAAEVILGNDQFRKFFAVAMKLQEKESFVIKHFPLKMWSRILAKRT